MGDRDSWHDLGLSYMEAAHAIQTGVKYYQEILGGTDGSPKHLRTGLNMSKCEQGALVALLVRKGIITEEEYKEEIRLALNEEVWIYQQEYGITLR